METEKSIFFWKENNKYGFLNSFYTSFFVDENNIKYNCTEQYFMANKCLKFDKSNRVISIEEKPKFPKSKYVITGIYVFDNKVIDLAKTLKPSKRGELEITDLLNIYLKL